MRRFFEGMLANVVAHVRAMLWSPWDVGAAAIVEQGGQVVLVEHSYKSGWMFPGGAVERGEQPAAALIRELEEEIGLTQSAPPQFFGLYVRRRLWTTNLILVYRVRDAAFTFRPNWEIRALRLIDPAAPPEGTGPAIRRRLRELIGEAPPTERW